MSAFVVAAIGVGVTAIGTIKSSQAASKQAAEQKKANAAQQAAASASAQRERIKAVREARLRAGQVDNAGGSMGMGQSSSGIAGSLSSIGSQAGSNIANINVQEGFAATASAANQRAADFGAQAAKWQAIGSIGSQVTSFGMGMQGSGGTMVGNQGKDAIQKFNGMNWNSIGK